MTKEIVKSESLKKNKNARKWGWVGVMHFEAVQCLITFKRNSDSIIFSFVTLFQLKKTII